MDPTDPTLPAAGGDTLDAPTPGTAPQYVPTVKATESAPSAPTTRVDLPPEAASALPSARFGQFIRTKCLGVGGMGEVWKAWDVELRRWVALKFLKHQDDTARAYFQREAQLAAGLEHPNIAPIYDVGERDGIPFIVMKFIEGESLAAAKKTLTLDAKVEAVRRVAEAITFAHGKRVIHRDLKPANVMLDASGRAIVMDFGLAKEASVDGKSLGGSNVVVGTPGYMAPEQAKGRAEEQSDVYGVGAILYDLVTGRAPFTGETVGDVIEQVMTREVVWPRRLNPGTPEDLEAIILHALEKDRSRRYGTAKELAEDLAAFAEKSPLRHARRPTLADVIAKRIRKQPMLWATGDALVAAIIGGAVFGTTQLLRATHEAENRARAESEKARVEREERAKTAVALERASERLSFSLVLRGRDALKAGEGASAAVFFAEAYKAHASHLTRVVALNGLRDLHALKALIPSDGTVTAVAVSHDGRRLATAGTVARIFDAGTGEAIGKPMAAGVVSVAFSPDGRLLATGGRDRTARLWNVETGAAVGAEMEHDGVVVSVAFSLDGKGLVTAGDDGVALQWTLAGKPAGRPMEHGRDLRAAVYTPAGIVTAGFDSPTRTWDPETGAQRGEWLRPRDDERSLAISPDGKRVAVGGWLRVSVHQASRKGPETMRHADQTVYAVSFSPDGKWLASAGFDRTVRFWNPETGVEAAPAIRLDEAVAAIAFSGDGARLASVTQGAVHLWELGGRRPFERVLQHGEPSVQQHVADIGFSRDGRTVATASVNPSIRTWDAATGAAGITIEKIGPPSRVVFSADGLRLVTFESTRQVRTWSAADGSEVAVLWKPTEGGEWARAISADGSRIAASATQLRVHDVAAGAPSPAEFKSAMAVRTAAFSPDGAWLAGGGEEGLLHLWDAATGVLRWKKMAHDGTIRGIAWSSDGKRIATGSADGTARAWDAAGGEAIARVLRHSFKADAEMVGSVAFSPDGASLAVGGAHILRLWDVATGEVLVEYPPFDYIRVVAFSPDGKTLAVGTDRRIARLLDASFLTETTTADVALRRACRDTGLQMDRTGVIEFMQPTAWKANQ